jgi:hypothetical protein
VSLGAKWNIRRNTLRYCALRAEGAGCRDQAPRLCRSGIDVEVEYCFVTAGKRGQRIYRAGFNHLFSEEK